MNSALPALTIIAVPYAGADKYCYRNVAQTCREICSEGICELNFKVFELPGRGARNKEQLLADIRSMARDLVHKISAENWPELYGFFGHSMGALLSYEVLAEAAKLGFALPRFAYLTGCQAPGYRTPSNISALEGLEFWNTVSSYSGTPAAFIENEPLRNYFEPILKADFRAVEQYSPFTNATRIACDLYVRWGIEEHYSPESIENWRLYFTGKSDFHIRPGDHFFPTKNFRETAQDLAAVVKQYV